MAEEKASVQVFQDSGRWKWKFFARFLDKDIISVKTYKHKQGAQRAGERAWRRAYCGLADRLDGPDQISFGGARGSGKLHAVGRSLEQLLGEISGKEKARCKGDADDEGVNLLSALVQGRAIAALSVEDESEDCFLVIRFEDGSKVKIRYDWLYEWEMARACANLALRSMERQGRVECLGRGARNACCWAKRAPAEDPTGVAAPAAVRYLDLLASAIVEGDPLRDSCLALAGKICDRFGVEVSRCK